MVVNKRASQSYLLDYAEIDWQQGNPYSVQYKDIYWSRGDPIAEKRHVFANSHQLDTRGKGAAQFTILETGFGFGNNFLLTAELWRDLRHQGILNYIAIEKSPVNPADLKRHLQPLSLRYSPWLLEHYPLPFHTSIILWPEDNIRLTLIFDDVISALDNLSAGIDAWYLDGFNPASNTDLWNRKLYGRIYALSRAGATLSSYTVAGHVRQGLNHAGFDTWKSKGFGTKAQMLVGKRPGHWQPKRKSQARVAVLGSGIAGMACVRALQRRDLEVQLISNVHANAASNIPHLACYPQLGLRNETRYQFSLSACQYAQHANSGFNPVELHWRSGNAARQARMRQIADQFPDDYITRDSTSDDPSVRFLKAGWIANNVPDESIHHKADVRKFSSTGDHWKIYGKKGRLITQVDHLVVAMGVQSSEFIDLPLIPLRGQALTVRLDKPLAHSLAGDVGVIQGKDGLCTVGSTFQRHDTDLQARDSDSRQLLDSLRTALPDTSPEIINTHVGVRATTRDRLPLVGPMPHWPGEPNNNEINASYEPGLYVSTGYGSHGATCADLCGEYIANLISDEPLVLTRSQQKLLAVERFRFRDARTKRNRNTRHRGG